MAGAAEPAVPEVSAAPDDGRVTESVEAAVPDVEAAAATGAEAVAGEAEPVSAVGAGTDPAPGAPPIRFFGAAAVSPVPVAAASAVGAAKDEEDEVGGFGVDGVVT